jgi:formate-dependent nitrite reductase membrane component NrfD
MLFLVSIWTGKLSIALLFKRLAKESNRSRVSWVLTALVSILSTASTLSVALRPHVSQP